MCIGVNAQKIATVTHCQRASIWNYDPKKQLVRDVKSGLCMALAQVNGVFRIQMTKCDAKDSNQIWNFTFYSKTGLPYNKVV